jgi:hypothetical protein
MESSDHAFLFILNAVMQFAGQHPGGLGVGMALPGYVAQQQLGMGNNEMAWYILLLHDRFAVLSVGFLSLPTK